MPNAARELADAARTVGDYWRTALSYYDDAEPEMDNRWQHLLRPWVRDLDFRVCVDLAAGHGRNTRKLLEQPGCERVYSVDINEENASFCRRRFKDEPRVTVIRNDGVRISKIADASVTCFYCFDAMVHFDSDVVRAYLSEVRRVLTPAGRAFLHHSNLSRFPGRSPYENPENPASRNFMTLELFRHYAAKEGLDVLRQEPVDWLCNGSRIDGFAILARSGAAGAGVRGG
jgi:ubiquinone/menaquinone biosynthesis C-methylase UbiE